jgi:hypothetical protein
VQQAQSTDVGSFVASVLQLKPATSDAPGFGLCAMRGLDSVSKVRCVGCKPASACARTTRITLDQ